MQHLVIEELDNSPDDSSLGAYECPVQTADMVHEKTSNAEIATQEIANTLEIVNSISYIAENSDKSNEKLARDAYADLLGKIGIGRTYSEESFSRNKILETGRRILEKLVIFLEKIVDKITDMIDTFIGEDTRNFLEADKLLQEAYRTDRANSSNPKKNWSEKEWVQSETECWYSHPLSKAVNCTLSIAYNKKHGAVLRTEDFSREIRRAVEEIDKKLGMFKYEQNPAEDVLKLCSEVREESEILSFIKTKMFNDWASSYTASTGQRFFVKYNGDLQNAFPDLESAIHTLNRISFVNYESYSYGHSDLYRFYPLRYHEVIEQLQVVKDDSKHSKVRRALLKSIKKKINTIKDEVRAKSVSLSDRAIRAYLAICRVEIANMVSREKALRLAHAGLNRELLAYYRYSLRNIFKETF